MSATFKIAFDGGLREGFSSSQVTQVLVSRFRMSEDKARMLFSGGRVILKKGLSASQAKQYVSQLGAAGLELLAVPETDEAAPAKAAPARPTSSEGYRIVYAGGILPGHTHDLVVVAARARLKLGDAQLKTVFSGRELGLKRGLDVAGAKRYLALLRDIGMDVRCDPPLPAAAPTPKPEAPPVVMAVPEAAPAGRAMSEEEAVEEQMKATAFWEDPMAQQNDLDGIDDVDRRLMEAMAADFDVPSTAPLSAPQIPSLEGTDLGNATRHLAETMLNADALRAYEGEIAAAEHDQRLDETEPLPAEAPTLDRYGAPTAEPADDEYALQRTIVVVPDRSESPPPVPPATTAPAAPAAPAAAPAAPAVATPAEETTPEADEDEVDAALARGRKRQMLIAGAVVAAVVAGLLLLAL
ncbi:MAG: hypothetical protein KDH20_06645 [Rhodocyclaceae bacterium]|nr:hypothetical protein [Rhodocyclaceae bacterium]